MTQEKASKRPWSVSVETEAEDGLTITVPEIGRCLHDWEWADAEEWERDLDNADLIVTAVNERNALLSEVAQLKILYDRIFRIRATGDHGHPVQGVIDYEAKAAFEIALETLGKGR
jgi:hypothetical protein